MAGDASGPRGGPASGERSDPVDRRSNDPIESVHALAADALPGTATAATISPASEHEKPRRLLYVTLPGCWGALIFACLSFTPSLLPRGGLLQGVIAGITAAIGYGLGVLAASVWRAFADRD